MKNCKIGFIGCGNIASAIISGSLNSGYIKSENLYIFDTDKSKTCSFSEDMQINISDSSAELVSNCDYVFLTVKPQVYDMVINEIKPFARDTCFVAVAAGITIEHIKKKLEFDAPVIRVMPNTPLMYSKGATGIVKQEPISDEQFAFIKGFFECCGIVEEVSEDKINIVTAISGSAPAYVMRFAKDFIAFAERYGLDSDTAKSLVLQAISGSAEMVVRSTDSIDTLIKNVTSPNGTTEAGLNSLDKGNFDSIIEECLKATVIRAEELTK